MKTSNEIKAYFNYGESGYTKIVANYKGLKITIENTQDKGKYIIDIINMLFDLARDYLWSTNDKNIIKIKTIMNKAQK